MSAFRPILQHCYESGRKTCKIDWDHWVIGVPEELLSKTELKIDGKFLGGMRSETFTKPQSLLVFYVVSTAEKHRLRPFCSWPALPVVYDSTNHPRYPFLEKLYCIVKEGTALELIDEFESSAKVLEWCPESLPIPNVYILYPKPSPSLLAIAIRLEKWISMGAKLELYEFFDVLQTQD